MDFTQKEERQIGTYFWWSVVLKGVISAGEIAAGLLIFFVPLTTLTAPFIKIAGAELFEEPGNLVAGYLVHAGNSLALAGSTFVAVYLLTRGLIKLLLIIALLKHQLWAYPSSLVVLGLFVAYQCYQFAVSPSIFLVVLTVFDLIVMYFIWREWQVLDAHLKSV